MLILLDIVFAVLSWKITMQMEKAILDIQSGSAIESNYDYRAPRSIVYKVDMYGLLSNDKT